MAGNQTQARKDAEFKLNQAIKAKAKPSDIAVLQAAYDAARTAELKATGQNEQAGR